MANVSELFPLSLEEEESSQSEIDFEAETLDHTPYWSSVFDDDTIDPPILPIFSPEPSLQRSDHEGQIILDLHLDLDLFERCPPPESLDTSNFRVFDGVESMASDYLGLGLGLGFDIHEQEQEEEDHSMDHGDGLRFVGFESDSASELDPNSHDQDPNLPPLCWDSLRLEEDRWDLDENFEWEEVDGRLGERDFLSMMVGERSRSSEVGEDEVDEEGAINVDWEVLIHVSNVMAENSEVLVDGDFINPSEYEVLFEQFADHESAIRGTPPAAKSVVDNLPSIVLTQDDVAKNNAICAVCKDEISLEEKVKQLPCLHHYHGDCILPWLGMRNTCPVCRHELPTDDPDYESWKAQRRAINEASPRLRVKQTIGIPSSLTSCKHDKELEQVVKLYMTQNHHAFVVAGDCDKRNMENYMKFTRRLNCLKKM